MTPFPIVVSPSPAAIISVDTNVTVDISALAWPDTVRHALTNEGVRVYNSDKAVAASADGRVIAFCQGNAVKIHSKAGTQPGHQTLDAPNAVLALALHAAGKSLAAAVTSMSGGR